MANIDGLPVNSAVTHAEFMSRTEDTSTTGSVNFQNVTESTSTTTGAIRTAGGLGVEKSLNVGLDAEIGGTLTVQTNLDVNGVATIVGILNTNDIAAGGNINTTLDMSANNILAVGDIEAQTEMITPLITATTADVGTLNLTNAFTAPSLTVTADATIHGNLTVNGTTVTLNTATVDSEDPNITVNKTGNDASSEGAGFTVDRTGTKGSFQYANALASKFKIGDLASEAEVVTVSHTQTLTNKTLTSPVLTTPSTDIISATEQGSTPATPAGGVRKLYPKADGFYQLDSTGLETKVGSGSGGGGVVNLITNGSADDAIASIFTPYLDSGSRPVDGVGPGSLVTTSVTSTNPLTGTKSYLLTKPAFDVQGSGWSLPATALDLSYRAKALKISVDYVVNSGTFVAGSRTTDSDIIWTCYDITNSKIVEPSNIKMFASSVSISDKFEATVQFDYNCTSFRLIAHCASTSTAAYEIKVDNVTVSPSVYVYGTPITDPVAYTPTLFNFGNGTAVASISRFGAFALIEGTMTVGSTLPTGIFGFSLPSGLVANYSLVPKGALSNDQYQLVGTVRGYGPVFNNEIGIVQRYAASTTQFQFTSESSADWSTSTPVTWVAGSVMEFEIKVQILGWSSSVQMSDSADTRVVAMKVFKTSNQSLTSGVETIVISWGVAEDTHGAFNTTTGIYTAPVEGWYEISGQVAFAANATGQRYTRLVKNGLSSDYGTLTGNPYSGGDTSSPFAFLTKCAAGTTLSVVAFQNSGGALNIDGAASTATHISIKRVTGPSAIAANESVNLRYTNTAGTSIANSGDVVVPFATKDFDSHGSWVTDTFTSNCAQKVRISANISFVSALYAAGNRIVASIYKNGSFYSYGYFNGIAAAATIEQGAFVSDTVSLIAGDTLQVRVGNNRTAGATSLTTTAGTNRVTIERIG